MVRHGSQRTVASDLKALGIDPSRVSIGGKPLSSSSLNPPYNQDSLVISPDGKSINIVVFCAPPGKPRMTRRDKWLKRPATTRYWDWCDRVRNLVGNAIPPAEKTSAVNWTAFFEPPASWRKADRISTIGKPHRVKPDRDNIDKAILDCLWKSDSGIYRGLIAKYYGETARLEIEILLN